MLSTKDKVVSCAQKIAVQLCGMATRSPPFGAACRFVSQTKGLVCKESLTHRPWWEVGALLIGEGCSLNRFQPPYAKVVFRLLWDIFTLPSTGQHATLIFFPGLLLGLLVCG